MKRLNLPENPASEFFWHTPRTALFAASFWLFGAASALADCDTQNPGTGQSVTCATPGTLPVAAQPGATNVAVTVTPSGSLSITNNNAILIFDQSQATNFGAVSVVGDSFDGISSRGTSNTLTNRGTITTTGQQSEGLFTSGSGNTLTNESGATITTSGVDSSAMLSFSSTISTVNILINRGNLVTTGNSSSGLSVFGSGNTLINDGSISTAGANADGVFANGSSNALTNNGTIDVSGTNTHGITWEGGFQGRIDNSGNVIARGANGLGVFLGDAVSLTNTASGRIESQQASGVLANGGGTFDNAGSIIGQLTGMTLVNGAATISNTGVITGKTAQGLLFSGAFDNSLSNSGVITGSGVAIQFDAGNDRLDLSGGVINGQVLMGNGNDIAVIRNTNESTLASTPLFDGGQGLDQLSFDSASTATGARYTGWESIALFNGSRLDLGDTLLLGDSLTATGTLSIDTTSSITAGQGIIAPFTAGQKVVVNNAGLIDLTAGGSHVGDSLTIVGDYVGNGARLNLQSVIAGDGAASDQLVVSQGTLSGATRVLVNNVGGLGALTTQNGIELVQANQGTTSSNQAFTLGNDVSVGAYQYYLFKGGVTAGSENSWYLRSSVVALPVVEPIPTPIPNPAAPNPQPPIQPAATAPVAAVGTPALPQVAAGESIALYRIEVPVYSVVPPAAALLAQVSLGTFHERQGEQGLLTEAGRGTTGWARTFGRDTRQSWGGTVNPRFDGNIGGFQVGNDVYAMQSSNGYTYHAGLFVTHASLHGDVEGFALGFQDNHAGNIKLDGDSLGAYWTAVDTNGWYVDAVAMGTRFDGHTTSERGVTLDLNGHAVSLSLESGYPIALSSTWVIEPQAQIIARKISMDDDQDAISQVAFDSQEYWTGRLGVRLKGDYRVANVPVQPYVRTNLWRTFGGSDTVTFNGLDSVKTPHESSIMDVGGGLQVRLSADVSLYAAADYSTNIDSHQQEAVEGTLGIRVVW